MPELPNLPAAARQVTGLARKGAHAATTLLGASFHPVRTVRSVTRMDDEPAPPPTDAKIARPSEPEADRGQSSPATDSPARDSRTDADGTEATAATREPQSAAEAVEAFEVETPPDLPVVPTGPAPHMPQDIADEIEREYGDELPGFRNGDEPPGTH